MSGLTIEYESMNAKDTLSSVIATNNQAQPMHSHNNASQYPALSKLEIYHPWLCHIHPSLFLISHPQ
jgi:hypothetical protein